MRLSKGCQHQAARSTSPQSPGSNGARPSASGLSQVHDHHAGIPAGMVIVAARWCSASRPDPTGTTGGPPRLGSGGAVGRSSLSSMAATRNDLSNCARPASPGPTSLATAFPAGPGTCRSSRCGRPAGHARSPGSPSEPPAPRRPAPTRLLPLSPAVSPPSCVSARRLSLRNPGSVHIEPTGCAGSRQWGAAGGVAAWTGSVGAAC